MPSLKMLFRVSAVATASLFVAGALAQMTTLQNTVLPALGQSRLVGPPPASQTVYFTVSLKPRFPAEFEAFAHSVNDPRSDLFHQWLTPAQVGQQFGATPSTVSAVVKYLKSKGMRINLQAPNNMAILAQGTVSQVQSAFATTLELYTGTDSNGIATTFRANSTPLKVPSAWAPQVQVVTGIQNWLRPHPASTQTLTPPLARGLYDLKTTFSNGLYGQGRTIAYSNWVGYRLSNLPLFISAFSLPVPPGGPGSNVKVVTLNGGAGPGAENAEGDLDMQMEIASAPLANILIYDDGAGDLVATLTKESSDNLADIISESYGWGLTGFPAIAVAAHTQHLAMSSQGQTYMAASGDGGTGWAVSLAYPDADPDVLDVGGTIATVDSVTGARLDEVGWDGSGGGWTTSGFPFDVRPSWQVGPGVPPPSLTNSRLVPDIGLQAGGPGAFVMYFGGSQILVDGTSCSSPYTAGGLAIIEQQFANLGLTARQGQVSQVLYPLDGRSDLWFDVTSGSNGTLPNGQPSVAGPGWDTVTGLGAPKFDALFQGLLQVISPTPYPATNATTVLGTYVIGDDSSLAASDGIDYQVASAPIPQFGEAAGIAASFTIPTTTAVLSIEVQADANGVSGGTTMVWLFNWTTGSFDLIGSTPLPSASSKSKVLRVRTADVVNYIGPGGEVDTIVRGHLPIRPFQNSMPVPFTYRVDFLQALAR